MSQFQKGMDGAGDGRYIDGGRNRGRGRLYHGNDRGGRGRGRGRESAGLVNYHNSGGGGGGSGANYYGHSSPSGYHPRGGDRNNLRTVSGSFPGLHQASDWQARPGFSVGSSSSSSQNLEKKSNSWDISQQFDKLSVHSSNSTSSRFPLRPDFGSRGTKCDVTANHFLITLSPTLHYIHHYNVTIRPKISSKIFTRMVMEELVQSYKQSFLGNVLLAYDGRSSFYTANSLPFKAKEFDVSIPNEGGARRQFIVEIGLVSVIELQKLKEFLAGKNYDSVQEVIQAFDVVLRQTPMLKFVPVKRSFYSNSLTLEIGGGLEAWKGFYQSARPTQIGLSLNMDVSAAAFVQNIEVINFVKEILNVNGLSTTRALSDTERLKVKRALKGLKVEVKHRQNGRQIYTISGLTKEHTKELTFALGNNGEMKYVVRHFLEKYGWDIAYTSLPCLQVGNKGTLLPMEVCKIIGGQRYDKLLNEQQTAQLVNLNNQKPVVRQAEILEMVRQNDYQKDEYAKEFGIRIADSPVSVQARVLPSPKLSYHDSHTQPRFGQWNMKSQKMFEGATVSSWSCLNFAVSNGNAYTFCEKVATSCNTHGMNFNPKPILPPYRGREEQVEHDLETIQKNAMARLNGRELDLLIVILPNKNGSLYGEVKRICETKLGLVSQCVLAKTALSMNLHSLANIVLKINAKVGGTNVVLTETLPMVSDRPTIIFGADVTHPNPGDDVSPSIAAVVASQNWPNITKYVAKFSAQRKEIILDLDRMVKEHLHSFVENNNQRRPERIIFYRDGVSEGQFDQVVEYELKAIRKAWHDAFSESDVPAITFVVVQKRHHTKLFPVNDSKADRSGNIHPGTVVDSGICHPSQFDFYLCSHAGIKSTSRPAHYHVLWDDNKFTADTLQTLTNNLCYIYARCTRSVSYVSPAYYAHLAAFRARFYVLDDSYSDESSVRGKACKVNVPVKQLPPLCEKLKNLQFYC